MAIDFSWLGYYVPIFGFLFVFVVMYAVLSKTSVLGESGFVNSLVSFVFAIIFVTFLPAVNYVQTIIPWFVILIICLFFFLVIVGFSQKDIDKFMKPWIAWVFIGFLALIFLISAIYVFNPVFVKGIADLTGNSQDQVFESLRKFVISEKFFGGIFLLIIAAVTSWVLTKKSK
ncbi:hypothetical protein COU56_01635 [Candidatus Pacearchaeota archaeon CG10_big_fil_rev_8_21_14_0_10_31_9]|nr:MAG: hypothetical protein AUJ62_01045 [Candidatus Pacearchaeota archaeon CG1_02_32_21]PIN95432.1 MAG: hypothetical protein COU56_01635 [Candidatus Pacearchaeota archaeon CG10_big_fil_rev_8_21_14_0_10_31_9]PIZ82446.1 MAG: hypothetical protein COX97_04790 [Candidatus Pacearchaeota archaeon CG_4_10_14_0_2_um_filter_05_32_18]